MTHAGTRREQTSETRFLYEIVRGTQKGIAACSSVTYDPGKIRLDFKPGDHVIQARYHAVI